MAADLGAALAAVCLFPLFVFIPGYVCAWACDLFDFRRRTLPFRVALSIPLSMALCPVATYFADRFAPPATVWVLYAACWGAFIPIAAREWRRLRIPRRWWMFGVIAAVWMALALLSSVDLQFGGRVYFPTIALDSAVRTQYVHSIAATGVPPATPFFYPGHSVPLRYHYFWLLLCSLVSQATGGVVGPRAAWTGGTVWCGFGFLGVLALFFRLLAYRGPASLRRRILMGIALACVSGLDMVPTAFLWMLRAAGMKAAIFPVMEFWNEQIYGFVSTVLWAAHHLAGLVICLMAWLLLSHGTRRASVLAGICLASAAGTSIYVSFTFAVFLAVWTVLNIRKGWWRDVQHLVLAGIIGLALFLPYGRDLWGGNAPMQFWIRPFRPVDAVLRMLHVNSVVRVFCDAALLPVNYLFGLGVFAVTAVIWWRGKRKLARTDLALASMIGASVLVCTFLRSSVVSNNDLGWRGFLLAQFALLLWAVDVLGDIHVPHRRLVSACLVLGAAATAYNVVLLRVYPILADHDVVLAAPWFSPDPDLGRRNYAAREAYAWVNRGTPRAAVIQFNPRVTNMDVAALLYSERRIAAADEECFSSVAGDVRLCAPLVARLNTLYTTAPESLDAACRDLPVDIFVAKDTDPAWADRRSWVWNTPPRYANPYYRVFACGH